jgi:hypothetical protein
MQEVLELFDQDWTMCTGKALPPGTSFAGGIHTATTVEFLADRTWVDADAARHSEQEIFDAGNGL